VSEVITNAIVHAQTSIDFSLEHDGKSVVVSLRDHNSTRPGRRQRTVDEAGPPELRILDGRRVGVETGREGKWFSLPLKEMTKDQPVAQGS
jgi:hypothetical protein